MLLSTLCVDLGRSPDSKGHAADRINRSMPLIPATILHVHSLISASLYYTCILLFTLTPASHLTQEECTLLYVQWPSSACPDESPEQYLPPCVCTLWDMRRTLASTRNLTLNPNADPDLSLPHWPHFVEKDCDPDPHPDWDINLDLYPDLQP